MSRHYYLGPWVWDDTDPDMPHYRAPEGTVGLIDLRPVAPVLSMGFFALSDDRDLGADYDDFGDGTNRLEDVALSPSQRAAWSSVLGIGSISGNTLLDALWETLTLHGDPDGGSICPPLMPTHRGMMELHLGGHSLVKSQRFAGVADPAYSRVQALIQRNYRAIHERGQSESAMIRTQRESPVLQPRTPRFPIWSRIYARMVRDQSDWDTARDAVAADSDIIHSKFLWCMAAKTRCPWQGLIPGDLPQEPPRRPDTMFTESWPTDGSDITSGQDQVWSVVAGSWSVSSGRISSTLSATNNFAQCTSDLSSSDHYAKTAFYPSGSPFGSAPAARCSGAAVTAYVSIFRTGDKRLFRTIASSFTQLGTTSSGGPSSGDTGQVRADGSSISLYYNGTETIGPITDTSISSGTRCGVYGFDAGMGALDNFEAADLVAGGYSLDAGHGSFSLSGQAAGLRHNKIITVNTGSFAISGQNTGLKKDSILATSAGMFALNGQSPDLQYHRVIAAGHGSFTLSGQDAPLQHGFVLTANVGTFALSGQDVPLAWDHILTAAYGAFALSGQNAATLHGFVLAAGTGAFVLSGQIAPLQWGHLLDAETGAFILTGIDSPLIWSGEVFVAPPRSRGLKVLPEDRTVRVLRENRTMKVLREDRTVRA